MGVFESIGAGFLAGLAMYCLLRLGQVWAEEVTQARLGWWLLVQQRQRSPRPTGGAQIPIISMLEFEKTQELYENR